MRVYKKKEGYYYKIYKMVKNYISQKNIKQKRMMGGISANNILENYYLCTQSRYINLL